MPEHSSYFTLTPAELAGYEVETESKPPKPGKRDKKSADKEMPREIQTSLETLQQALNQRAVEFGLVAPKLEIPPLPPELDKKHFEALSELFGADDLEAIVCPSPDQLTDDYFTMMYPETQRDEDTRKGLTSYRPNYWNNTAGDGFSITEVEAKKTKQSRATWGELFCKSMRIEAAQISGAVLLAETIQKPTYDNGRQQYGTKEGIDATKDNLLPIIHEVFGATANRFNLTWDQINQQLVPKLKEKLAKVLESKGVEMGNIDVIVTPAVISNLQTTLKHQSDSETNTYDWSSTPLITQDNKDSGCRLLVGFSDNGGAGYVGTDQRGAGWNDRGFRLSVVLKKP